MSSQLSAASFFGPSSAAYPNSNRALSRLLEVLEARSHGSGVPATRLRSRFDGKNRFLHRSVRYSQGPLGQEKDRTL